MTRILDVVFAAALCVAVAGIAAWRLRTPVSAVTGTWTVTTTSDSPPPLGAPGLSAPDACQAHIGRYVLGWPSGTDGTCQNEVPPGLTAALLRATREWRHYQP